MNKGKMKVYSQRYKEKKLKLFQKLKKKLKIIYKKQNQCQCKFMSA